jgi:hypothetical protein
MDLGRRERECSGMDYFDLAEEWGQWSALVNKVMNLLNELN